MTSYRLYELDASGRASRATYIEASSSDEALVLVRVKKLPCKWELWERDRRIDKVRQNVMA